MLYSLFNEIIIPFFQSNRQQFIINFFRFLMGCFFECFPISSSFFNTLFYNFNDEHKMAKNNTYIHLITGIAAMFIFIKLRIHCFAQEAIQNSFIFNPNFFFPWMVKAFVLCQCIGYNHLKIYANIFHIPLWFRLPWAIFHLYLFQYINFSNNGYHLIFWSYNLYICGHFCIKFIQKIMEKKYWLLWLFFIIIGASYLLPLNNYLILNFIISLIKTLCFRYFSRIREKNLLFIGFFINGYFNIGLLNYIDGIVILIAFIYKFINKYVVKETLIIDPQSIYIDHFFKCLIVWIISIVWIFLMKNWIITTINPMIGAPIGLLLCFPIIRFIKKKYYSSWHSLTAQKISLIISILMTIVFSFILFMYHQKNTFYIVNKFYIYGLIGFTNGFAFIPGFSRMLLTFLMGFLCNLSIIEIITINYGMASITSLGQWFIEDWDGDFTITSIINNINKKINYLYLLFSYKNRPWQSFWIILFLIFWSYCLMNYFLPSLYQLIFWKKCIFLRLITNLIYFFLLKYHF